MMEYMMWMQTIMIGVNTVVLLLMTGTTIRWVMLNEKERKHI
jgi:hypothetical protein